METLNVLNINVKSTEKDLLQKILLSLKHLAVYSSIGIEDPSKDVVLTLVTREDYHTIETLIKRIIDEITPKPLGGTYYKLRDTALSVTPTEVSEIIPNWTMTVYNQLTEAWKTTEEEKRTKSQKELEQLEEQAYKLFFQWFHVCPTTVKIIRKHIVIEHSSMTLRYYEQYRGATPNFQLEVKCPKCAENVLTVPCDSSKKLAEMLFGTPTIQGHYCEKAPEKTSQTSGEVLLEALQDFMADYMQE